MKISVITPSYNQGDFIEETIDSILSQGYSDLDYIIIDGGSTDNTVEIIKKHEKHLTYWVSEPDKGQSHAINKGLQLASGDIINWLNSDDYLEPGALKTIGEAFKNSDTNVFIGRSNIVENGNVLRQSRGTDIYPENLAKTIGLARIDQPEHWWRKSVIDKIGPLNTHLHYTMDRDWWVKYLLRYGFLGIKKTDAVLSNFRLHPDSKTVSSATEFFHERNQYFSTLAQQFNIAIPTTEFTKPYKEDVFGKLHVSRAINAETIHDSIQHFLVLLADETYHLAEYKVSKQILKHIDITLFNRKDKIFYQKLRMRAATPRTIVKASKWLRS